MLEINKQKMYYSLKDGVSPVYEYDEEGNIRYITGVDGEQIPVESGDYEDSYAAPTFFKANISNKLSEVLLKEFGVDDSTNFCQIVADKDALPLAVGALIWRKSALAYKDTEQTVIDPKSADYTVMGVADEGLTADLFLLQRIV